MIYYNNILSKTLNGNDEVITDNINGKISRVHDLSNENKTEDDTKFNNNYYIQTSKNTKVPDAINKKNTTYKNIVFHDIDNVNLDTRFMNTYKSNTYFLFFAARNSTKLQSLKTINNDNFYTYVSGSIAKDAGDHLLSFYLGIFSHLYNDKFDFFILTKDHYGEAVANFINAKHACTIEELDLYLKK